MSVCIHRHSVDCKEKVDGVDIRVDPVRPAVVKMYCLDDQVIAEKASGNCYLPSEEWRVNARNLEAPAPVAIPRFERKRRRPDFIQVAQFLGWRCSGIGSQRASSRHPRYLATFHAFDCRSGSPWKIFSVPILSCLQSDVSQNEGSFRSPGTVAGRKPAISSPSAYLIVQEPQLAAPVCAEATKLSARGRGSRVRRQRIDSSYVA